MDNIVHITADKEHCKQFDTEPDRQLEKFRQWLSSFASLKADNHKVITAESLLELFVNSTQWFKEGWNPEGAIEKKDGKYIQVLVNLNG